MAHITKRKSKSKSKYKNRFLDLPSDMQRMINEMFFSPEIRIAYPELIERLPPHETTPEYYKITLNLRPHMQQWEFIDRYFIDGRFKHPNLEILYCSGTQISELPDLLKLKELNCSSSTLISRLPNLPKLETLYCTNTQISELPDLPKLETLDCSITPIRELPDSPNLNSLCCSSTLISRLPNLPKLETLYCDDTQISELPDLPNLKTLYCYDTHIRALPDLPMLHELKFHIGQFSEQQLNDFRNRNIILETGWY